MKQCSRCKQSREIIEFYKRHNSLDGYCGICKICFRQSKPRRDSRKNWNLVTRYGITLEQYNTLYSAQDGKCAICKRVEILRDKRGIRELAVDHDHTTGKVRGLLCSSCNQGIGYFKDNPELLNLAAEYLRTDTP